MTCYCNALVLSFLKAYLWLFPQVIFVRGSAVLLSHAQPGRSSRVFHALCSACISPLDEVVLNTNTWVKYIQVLQKSPPPWMTELTQLPAGIQTACRADRAALLSRDLLSCPARDSQSQGARERVAYAG